MEEGKKQKGREEEGRIDNMWESSARRKFEPFWGGGSFFPADLFFC